MNIGVTSRRTGAPGVDVFTYDGQPSGPDPLNPSQPPPTDPTCAYAVVALHPILLTLFTLLCPAIWAVAALRRGRRVRRGHCRQCGYDLRAGPEKGGALLDRCPECGTRRDATT